LGRDRQTQAKGDDEQDERTQHEHR
jgi:hypothetical protein